MEIREAVMRAAHMMEARLKEFDDIKGKSYLKVDLRKLIELATKNYNNGSHRISSDREMGQGTEDLIDTMNLIVMVLVRRGTLEQLPPDELERRIEELSKDTNPELEKYNEPGEGGRPTEKEVKKAVAALENIEDKYSLDDPSESPLVNLQDDNGPIIEQSYAGSVAEGTDVPEHSVPSSSEREMIRIDHGAAEATLENPTGAKTLQELTDEKNAEKEDSDADVREDN